MASLSHKLLNLLQYFGVRSRNYYHSEAVANYDPDQPLAYYLDHTPRAAFLGQTDPNGLPLYTAYGTQNYLPVLISLVALGHCDLYLRTGNADHRTALRNAADWFVQAQRENGGWPNPCAAAATSRSSC